jgi:hypothetical protein
MHDGLARVALLCSVIVVASLSPALRGGTIFDDDWTPSAPRKTVSPPPSAPVEPPKPAGAASKASPPALPVPSTGPTPTTPAPATRRPIPEKASRARSRALFKELFAKELADRSALARRAFAVKLLEEAAKNAGVPADHYVLLVGAAESAQEGSDLSLCIKAVDTLAATFELDGLQFKSEIAQKMTLRTEAVDLNAANGRAGLELAKQLQAADDYVPAARLLALLRPAVSSDPALTRQVQSLTKEIDVIRTAETRIASQLEKLKGAPLDPAANMAVGQFYCLIKGDWVRGLPMLAAGNDAVLQALAKKDLAGPTGPDDQVALADAWWGYAAKASGIPKSRAMARAGKWYAGAAPALAGLAKTRVENRLKEIVDLQGGSFGLDEHKVVNLLSLVDLKRDVIRGKWESTPAGLSSDNTHPLIRFPYHPPAEYDFRVEYTRQKGSLWVVQAISHDDVSLGWNMRSDGLCGFEWVDGRNVDDEMNPTRVRLPKPQQTGRHVSVVQVRRDSISAYVDGKLAVQYKTDWTGLHDGKDYAIGAKGLGLMTYDTPTIFHVVEVLEVSGEGSVSTSQ